MAVTLKLLELVKKHFVGIFLDITSRFMEFVFSKLEAKYCVL